MVKKQNYWKCLHGSQIHITLRGTGYNFQSEITFVMIAVLLVAENTSELVLIIIHLSGFFFFFTMVCAIFSLLRRIFDSCHSRVILSIFSLCLQVFYLVSLVSTKRMHRGTYIFEVFSCMYTKLYCDLRWWRFLSVYFQFVRASVSCANIN